MVLQELAPLWLAARDRRTPAAARIVAIVTVAYALSPLDLIPDIIPILGVLDDLLLVPAGLWLALNLLPPRLRSELRAQARELDVLPRNLWAAVVIVAIWSAIVLAITLALRR
jgi:uncharacterized membrane protein YkvA (DUF1232 family)